MAGGRKSPLFSRTSGGVYAIESAETTTGDVWFVGSTQTGASDTVGYGKTPDGPFATLDFAFSSGAVTASQGDIIFVMPGHAESTATDTELFDLDLAGVKVVGLGVGDNRPTFTITHVDATCVIGAANCSISNLQFVSNVADHKIMLEIEAAAVGTTVKDCLFRDTSSAAECLIFIDVATDADRLLIQDNHFSGAVGGEATEAILFAGGSDNTIIRNNLFIGDWKTNGAIGMASAASTGLQIYGNVISNADGAAGFAIKMNGSSTGIIAYNAIGGSKNGVEGINTVTAMFVIENYMTDVVAAAGIISNTVVSWSD